jgi:hypothetical protein
MGMESEIIAFTTVAPNKTIEINLNDDVCHESAWMAARTKAQTSGYENI